MLDNNSEHFDIWYNHFLKSYRIFIFHHIPQHHFLISGYCKIGFRCKIIILWINNDRKAICEQEKIVCSTLGAKTTSGGCFSQTLQCNTVELQFRHKKLILTKNKLYHQIPHGRKPINPGNKLKQIKIRFLLKIFVIRILSQAHFRCQCTPTEPILQKTLIAALFFP